MHEFLPTWTSELSILPVILVIFDAMTLMWRHCGDLNELLDIWLLINRIL